MVVVDASAIVDVIDGGSERSERIVNRLRGQALVAPHLIDQEVMHALRKSVLRDRVPTARADAALDRFLGIRIHRLATHLVLGQAWRMRDSVTTYDAAYVALAEALGVPLVTTDGHLARSHGTDAVVEVIA